MFQGRDLSSLKLLGGELRNQGINFDINEVLTVFEAETDGGKKHTGFVFLTIMLNFWIKDSCLQKRIG